jgi:predicted enzyme related to lactoylglutathione lyase
MNHCKMLLAAGVTAIMGATAAQAQTNPAQNDAIQHVTAMSVMASAIPSADLDRSIAFYTKGLGMAVGDHVEMPSMTEVPLMLPGGGASMMLVKSKAAGSAAPAHSNLSRIVLAVPDIKALVSRLTAAGYHLDAPLTEQPTYHVVTGMLQDPDGNHLELVERTP